MYDVDHVQQTFVHKYRKMYEKLVWHGSYTWHTFDHKYKWMYDIGHAHASMCVCVCVCDYKPKDSTNLWNS